MGPFPAPPRPEFNRDKFKELIHFVCAEAPNPNKLGATKLNKIAFYSDMEAYLLRGRPITGEVYVKRQHGPVPQHVNEVLRELQEERAIAISEATGFNPYRGAFTRRNFYSIRPVNLAIFDGEEVRIISDVVKKVCLNHTARSISEHSHNAIWEAAEMGEEIPYYTIYGHFFQKPGADALEWARAQIPG